MEVNKEPEAIDVYVAREEGLSKTFRVHHSKGEVIRVEWWENDEKFAACNFDLRAILEIIKKGGYRLE